MRATTEAATLGERRVMGGSTLALYGLAHAVVDAVCAGLLWSAVSRGDISETVAWAAFFVYNFLAFAVQPPVGMIVDRSGAPRRAAAFGALLTAAAFPLSLVSPAFFVAVTLAGLGNAVFHVGGGVVSLRFRPGKAWPPALFVAPGAAGVAGGIALGKSGGPVWLLALGLVALAVSLLVLPALERRGAATAAPRRIGATALEMAALLVLVVVGVRSYVGLTLSFPWRGQASLLVALTAGVVLGKALGGVLADRFGWRTVGVGALLVAPVLLASGADSAALGVAGALVFNLTMPVTLVAVAYALPGHEGFAFGLTCLALFVGAAPVLAGWAPPLSTPVMVLLSGCAAVVLWLALGKLQPVRSPSPAPRRAAPRAARTERNC